VRYVGNKTFIYHGGVWTDTTYDPDKMEPVPVSFGSEDYFALVTARPEWGRYLALGDHVIVVLDGTAYEIREGDAPPLESLPEETQSAAPSAAATTSDEPAPADETPRGFGDMLVDLLEWLVDAVVGFFGD
jgi:hypothetical protein